MTSDPRDEHALLRQDEFIDRVFTEIARCRSRVWLQCYIVKDGRLQEALFDRLAQAASRGVDVRLLYDPSGSHDLSGDRLQRLRRAGAAVRPFGRLAALGFLRPGIRDHERLVLVDDSAYVGGHAWADEWLPREWGGKGWRDLNCRFTGPLVSDCARLYERRWSEAPAGWPRPLDTGGTHPCQRLVSDGPGGRSLVGRAFRAAFDRAHGRIWIANAYFVPTISFKRALRRAARRGVDVRILTPGRSDLPMVQSAARSQYRSFSDAGIRLYEYQGPMFHAKYAIVDDDWCSIGSFNALVTSARATVETNLVVTRPEGVAAMARAFMADICLSHPVRDLGGDPLKRFAGHLARRAIMAAAFVLRHVNRAIARLLAAPVRLRARHTPGAAA